MLVGYKKRYHRVMVKASRERSRIDIRIEIEIGIETKFDFDFFAQGTWHRGFMPGDIMQRATNSE